jgi:hypothetical protein
MNNINAHSTIWYNDIPHKQYQYEGLVLNWHIYDSNNECYSILKSQGISIDGSIKEKYDNTFMFYNNMINSFKSSKIM